MQRITAANRVADLFGAGKDGFTDGSPTGGIPATFLNALWFNQMQEEVANAIEATGQVLSEADTLQLTRAIRPGRGADITAAPTITIGAGNYFYVTGDATITDIDFATDWAGRSVFLVVNGNQTYVHSVNLLVNNGGYPAELVPGDIVLVISDSAADLVRLVVMKYDGTNSSIFGGEAFVRQTVLRGPINADGTPNLGGATGGTSVTTSNISASFPLNVTASFGFSGARGRPRDYYGTSFSNLTWTGLSTNGTMYLFLSVNPGTQELTPFVSALPPLYGETVTLGAAGQFSFGIKQHIGALSNGSALTFLPALCVGEVSVAGGVVTGITWYAYQGRAESDYIATLPNINTQVSYAHNIGVPPRDFDFVVECTTAEQGIAVGEQIGLAGMLTSNTLISLPFQILRNNKTLRMATSSTVAFQFRNATTAAHFNATLANYKYKWRASRGW
jgi:hypothetical protein